MREGWERREARSFRKLLQQPRHEVIADVAEQTEQTDSRKIPLVTKIE